MSGQAGGGARGFGRRLAACWLVGLLFLVMALPALAQQEPLPERAAVEERLAALEEGAGEEGPSAEDQATIDLLTATLADLDALAEVEQRREALESRVEQAPQELIRLERELNEETTASQASAAELDELSLDELEARQQEAVVELQRLQDRLAEVNAQLLTAQTLPERAQQSIAEAMRRVEQARRDLDELDVNDVPADDPQRWRRQVARALAEARLLYHQRELATNTRLRELDQRRQELLTRQQASQEAELALLQNVIERKRRMASEQAIADAVRDDPLLEEGHPVLESAQQVNRALSQELLRANDRSNALVRESLVVRSNLDQVRQLERSLNEQIEAIRGSTLLARILREQRRALPQVAARRDLQDEIADLRLRQFDLARQRDQLREGERMANQRLAEAGVESSEGLVDSLQRLYQSRRELVDRLEQTYGSLLSSAIELQLNQQQLQETARGLRATIDEQLFWVANTRPLGLAWVRQIPDNLALEWREGEWRQVLPTTWSLPTAGAVADCRRCCWRWSCCGDAGPSRRASPGSMSRSGACAAIASCIRRWRYSSMRCWRRRGRCRWRQPAWRCWRVAMPSPTRWAWPACNSPWRGAWWPGRVAAAGHRWRGYQALLLAGRLCPAACAGCWAGWGWP